MVAWAYLISFDERKPLGEVIGYRHNLYCSCIVTFPHACQGMSLHINFSTEAIIDAIPYT